MQTFLQTVESTLSTGQRRLLQGYLAEVTAGRLPGSAPELEALLAQVGSLLDQPLLNLEDPESYNAALRTLLANLAGLYQEIDRLESAQAGLADLNRAQLDQVEGALRELSGVLAAAEVAHQARLQWSDVFTETFGGNPWREGDRSWYQPLPVRALSGQVESFTPAFIDPLDRSLKLLPGGDFCRSTNLQGQRLAQVAVEQLLGFSTDREHGVQQAVDGQPTTFWREQILSEAPLQADPLQVPWLPSTYTGGAAARLHFQFPFAVPFSEIQLRPFSHYPTQILQAVWDNRKRTLNNLVLNGTFSGGTTSWTTGVPGGNSVTTPSTGGYGDGPYLEVASAAGRTTLSGSTFALTGFPDPYHLRAKLLQTETLTVQFLLQWYQGATLLRSDWLRPSGRAGEWYEYSYLALAPSGATQGTLTLVADGTGTLQATDLTLAPAHGQRTQTYQLELDADAVLCPVEEAVGTDLWVVVAQPHYDLLHLSTPEGDLDQQALWEAVSLQAEIQAETLYQFHAEAWLVEGAGSARDLADLPSHRGVFQEAKRLGGRIYSLLLSLSRYLKPSATPRRVTRYHYVLGAWELRVVHRDYAPQGLYVTRPYHPVGEGRELALVTHPTLAELGETVQFWLTPRARDGADQAQLFTGRASFSALGETVQYQEATHFTLPPIVRRDQFPGTDRNRQLPLPQHPYLDRERLHSVYTALTSGTLVYPQTYDPNKLRYYLQLADLSLTEVHGYRPVEVTLDFPDGTQATPDRLGAPDSLDLEYTGPEILQTVTVEEESQHDTTRKRGRRGRRNEARQKNRKVTETALQTRYHPLVTGPNGVALSLYWHKSTAVSTSGATSGEPIFTGDKLIAPNKYTVDPETGLITVKSAPPNNDPAYDSFTAYYYYHRTDEGLRYLRETREDADLPTGGLDLNGPAAQRYPVTRNMTDYIHGVKPVLRPSQLDDLLPDYYPVYEYWVDDRGVLAFADQFHPQGDTPARITVEYRSLEIEPRLLIEFPKREVTALNSQTPLLHDFSLFMNCRR
jgi:hypothetical protein